MKKTEIEPEKAENFNLRIYPNPAIDIIIIKTNENSCLQIYDNTGNLIRMIECYNPLTVVDVTKFNPWVYLIRSISEEAIFTETFIIQ